MKKFLLTLVVVIGMTLFASTVWAAPATPKVILNNQEVSFPNNPVIHEGTTMVPFRNLLEALDVTVVYNAADKSITSTKGSNKVEVFIGQKVAIRNGTSMQLTIAPYVDKGVTYVPLRFLSQSFDYAVDFKNNTIYISSPSSTASVTPTPASPTSGKLTVEQIGEKADAIAFIQLFNENGRMIATGSGVAISADGDIITNFHVIEGATTAKVHLNNNVYTVDHTLLVDSKRDLALLKIDAQNIPYVTIGDSSKLVLGESVVTIGAPLGFESTLSTGNISTTSRDVDGEKYIQITAPIDSGSSGGALFNMNGELVGITTAMVISSANINLAIPSNDVKTFLNQTRTKQLLSVHATKAKGSVTEAGARQLQKRLNDEFTYLYNDVFEIELFWMVEVIREEDDIYYSIMAILPHYSDFITFKRYLDNRSPDSYAGVYQYIFSVLEEYSNVDNSFVMLTVATYVPYIPPSYEVPSEFVEYDYKEGMYAVFYPFSAAYQDGDLIIFGTDIEKGYEYEIDAY